MPYKKRPLQTKRNSDVNHGTLERVFRYFDDQLRDIYKSIGGEDAGEGASVITRIITGGGSGAIGYSTFLALSDTPENFTDKATFLLRVNADEDAVEFYDDANFQAADADLTAIAALSPSDDDVIQRKSSAWTNRTLSQLATDLQTYLQALDTDLTAIAGLSPSNDDIIQRKAGAWTNRTLAQLVTDLLTTSLLNENCETLLASVIAGAQNGDSATTIYTVPSGKALHVTKVVVRNATASLAGGTDFDLGAFKTAVDLSAITTYSEYIILTNDNTVLLTYPAGGNFDFTVNTGATADADVDIDLFGYLT